MKIVITDGYTLNPGDLSWKDLETLGELVYYDRTPVDLVAERCREAEVIVTNKTPVNAQTITAAGRLKLIAVTATGYNMVDTDAARAAGVDVCNVPAYGTDSVAQHAIALLLECSNQVGLHARSVRDGDWARSADFSYSKTRVIELRGKVLGIVGMGRIGQQTARIGEALGMELLYYNRSARPEWKGRVADMEELFEKSDFISLHCPLTAENKAFINKALLSRMKPGAWLINTSRGALIHEADLADALRSGVLAGAALDVLVEEPPRADHPLLGLDNCIITPHNAWISIEARRRIMQTTYDNVARVLAGRPQNVVNPKDP